MIITPDYHIMKYNNSMARGNNSINVDEYIIDIYTIDPMNSLRGSIDSGTAILLHYARINKNFNDIRTQDAMLAHSYRFWRIACSHNTVRCGIPPLYMRNRKLFFRALLYARAKHVLSVYERELEACT